MEIKFKDVAKFVWGYISRSLTTLFILLLILALKIGIDIMNPYLFGELADAVTNGTPGNLENLQQILFLLLLIAAQSAFFWIINIFGAHNFYDSWKLPLSADVATDGLKNVQSLSTDWHVNSFAGATVRKITRGTYAFEHLLDQLQFGFVPLTLLVFGMAGFAWIRWPTMGVLVVAGGIIYAAGSTWIVQKLTSKKYCTAIQANNRVGATLADTLTADTTVKNFAREESEQNFFQKAIKNWSEKQKLAYFANNFASLAQSGIMLTFKMAIIGLAIYFWWIGEASVGDVVFFIGIYNLFSAHLRNVGERIRQTQIAIHDMADIVEFSLTQPEIIDHPDAKKLKVESGMIAFEKIDFAYKNQPPIFKNFSIEIPAGQSVALVGHSGAGKSTFVKLVQRLYDVDSGAIKIDEQNIAAVTQKSLRRAVGLVPQDPILFHRSLAENIAYGQPQAKLPEIKKVAKAAHAADFIEKLEKKYDTLVGERGVKLSGGERQRVAIARAMLADTPILILDEATSSLDSESESFIQDALQKLMKNRTTIVVAHRLSTIKSVDRILVFEDGEVVEDDSHAKLIRKKNGIYKKLYELQAGGFISE